MVDPNVKVGQTYSILSLQLVKIAKVALAWHCINMVYQGILFLQQSEKFKEMYFIGYTFTDFICIDRMNMQRFFSKFALLKYFCILPLNLTTELLSEI